MEFDMACVMTIKTKITIKTVKLVGVRVRARARVGDVT